MRLIDDAGRWYRLYSVQIATLIAAYAALPPDMQRALAGLVGITDPSTVTAIAAVALIAARMVKQ